MKRVGGKEREEREKNSDSDRGGWLMLLSVVAFTMIIIFFCVSLLGLF